MSRYFTNVKNTIEERVNTSYIDELYTKDAQGEFRKIVAGESEGTDIELPTYLKEDRMELFGTNVFNAIKSAEISMGSGLNPASLTNRTTMTRSGFRVTGVPANNYTNYGRGIITNNFGNELNLEDIINSQKNYLKPDKIEFNVPNSSDTIISKGETTGYTKMKTNSLTVGAGSDSSSETNHARLTALGMFVIGPNVVDHTRYQRDNIQRYTADGIKTINLLDADKVVNNLKTLNSTAAEIDNAVANSGGGAVPDYIQPEGIRFQNIFEDYSYPIEVKKNSNTIYARIRNNEIGLISETHGYSSELGAVRLTLRDNRGDTLSTEYGNDEMRVIYGDPRIYLATATRDVINVTNNLKDLTVSAADINTVVGGGGGRYYLKDNSIEIETTGGADTSFRSIGPVTHTQITSNAFRAYRNANTNPAFSNTTVDGNGMTVKGSTTTNYTEYLNNDIWVINGAQSFNASVQDIITSTNKIKAVTASAADLNVSHIRYNSAGADPASPIRFHTSTSGMTYANTIKIPRTPGKYAIRLSGAWGSIGVGSSKDFYFMGSNDFITVDAMISQNSNSNGRLIVTPIMKDGSISGGDGHFSCKFELHNANSGSNWELDGTFLVFTNYGLLIDADTWTLE